MRAWRVPRGTKQRRRKREIEDRRRAEAETHAQAQEEGESIEDFVHSLLAAALDMTVAPFVSKQPAGDEQQRRAEQQQQPQTAHGGYEASAPSDEMEQRANTNTNAAMERQLEALRAHMQPLLSAGWDARDAAAATAPPAVEASGPMIQCPISSQCGRVSCARLVDHVVNECPHRLVDCPYDGCTRHLAVSELAAHQAVCGFAPVQCANACETAHLLRKDYAAHAAECPSVPLPCRYHRFGCRARVARADMDEHLAMHLHEHMAMMADRVHAVEDAAPRARPPRALERACAPVLAGLDDAAEAATFAHVVALAFVFMVLRMFPTFVLVIATALYIKAFHRRWVRQHVVAAKPPLRKGERTVSHGFYLLVMSTVLYVACYLW